MRKTEKFWVENIGFGFVARFGERLFPLDYKQAEKFALKLKAMLVNGGTDIDTFCIFSTVFNSYAKKEEFIVTRADVYTAWIEFKRYYKMV